MIPLLENNRYIGVIPLLENNRSIGGDPFVREQ